MFNIQNMAHHKNNVEGIPNHVHKDLARTTFPMFSPAHEEPLAGDNGCCQRDPTTSVLNHRSPCCWRECSGGRVGFVSPSAALVPPETVRINLADTVSGAPRPGQKPDLGGGAAASFTDSTNTRQSLLQQSPGRTSGSMCIPDRYTVSLSFLVYHK